MNGELAFTLGLESGGFLSAAKASTNAISAMIGTAARFTGVAAAIGAALESLKAGGNIVQGIFDAFQRGADLERLHAKTGESVKDLFLLEKGFKATGVEANDVGGMLYHLQKALSGMSEGGEETYTAFAMLGLSMQQIAAMKGPQQFQAIAEAMNHLGRAQASVISGKLFGREGAENFLQLARSGQAFGQAMRDNADAAERMARNAAAFNQIELAIGKLKGKTQNFFAGIAEGAAPGIQKVLDMLNKIDLTALGQKFGDVIAVFAQSIQDHKIGELLKLSLNAGLEGFENYFVAIMAGINAAMQKLFENLLENGNIVKNYVTGQLKVGLGTAKVAIGLVRAGATGSAAGYDQFKSGQNQAEGGIATMFKGIGQAGQGTADSFASAFKKSLAQASTPAAKQFVDLFNKELKRATTGRDANRPADFNAPPGQGVAGGMKPIEGTSLEKMGFIFRSGGPSLVQDHARATATFTQRTAVATEQILARMGQTGGGGGEFTMPT